MHCLYWIRALPCFPFLVVIYTTVVSHWRHYILQMAAKAATSLANISRFDRSGLTLAGHYPPAVVCTGGPEVGSWAGTVYRQLPVDIELE